MEPITTWPPETQHHDPATSELPVLKSTQSDKINQVKLDEQIMETKTAKKLKLDDGYKEDLANVALAKWWRTEGRQGLIESENILPNSSSPNTLLKHITQLPTAQRFLRLEITRLLRKVQSGAVSAQTHAALATFMEKCGDLPEAVTHIKKAVAQDATEKEYKWLSHKLCKKLRIEEDQETLMQDLEKKIPPQLHESIPIERRSGTYLTIAEFYTEYALRGIPVIITDVVQSMTTVPWTLQHIKQVAGSCLVTLKKLVPGSAEWAQLEEAETVTVADYINSLPEQRRTPLRQQRYLFDWSIPVHCPQLAEELTIPKYFANDFLQRLDPGSLYHDSWPSLFIAPEGLRSELHVDAFGSNFWMAIFHGRKRWVIFHKDELPLLYPSYESDHSTDPTFHVDLRQPDLQQHPLLLLLTPRECIMQPGELLFVPAGSPHYVENLDQTIAISSNYVDSSNLTLVRGELAVDGLINDRAENLLDQINSTSFQSTMNSSIQDMPWKDFKRWPKSVDFSSLLEPSTSSHRHGAYDVFCHGPLLDMVQRSGIYPDSKTFVDMHMLTDPHTILREFDVQLKHTSPTTEQIRGFVDRYFAGPGGELEICIPKDWTTSPKLLEKISDPQLQKFGKALNDLWKILGRKIRPLEHPERHSLIQVPNLFIIPGDRFREFYYWDTYWIVGGLLAVDMIQTVRGILENFLFIVDKHGFVPNGGRIYYLERSQPPLLIPMINLYYQRTEDLDFIRVNISVMEKEQDFWLQNRSVTVVGSSGREHRMARYHVTRTHPRPEGYCADADLAKDLPEAERSRIWSQIASACESGWDFSTRWLDDVASFVTVKTGNIIPVDLNVYICLGEQLLAMFHGLLGNQDKQNYYEELVAERKRAIDDLFWQEDLGAWFDYDLDTNKSRTDFFPSNVFPLMADCTNIDYSKAAAAQKILNYVKKCKVFDSPGGVPTSMRESGQQWDYPNAWSPLVHFTLESIAKLPLQEAQELTQKATQNWVMSNMVAWQKHGHLYEKYDIREFGSVGGGGEYDVQVGFGWTNGVVLMLLEQCNCFHTETLTKKEN